MIVQRTFVFLLWSLCMALGLAHAESAQAARRALDDSKLQLASVNALIYDLSTGKPIYSKNHNAVVPIASITKLMTAMADHRSGCAVSESAPFMQNPYR